jgi:hypothetical protein
LVVVRPDAEIPVQRHLQSASRDKRAAGAILGRMTLYGVPGGPKITKRATVLQSPAADRSVLC